MIRYSKLFTLLYSRGMKKTDLLEVISAPTLAKLSKGDVVKVDVIEKICVFLKCQPGDIMEYVDVEKLKTDAYAIDQMQKEAISQLHEQGYTDEQLKSLLSEVINDYFNKAVAGENPIFDMLTESLKKEENQD